MNRQKWTKIGSAAGLVALAAKIFFSPLPARADQLLQYLHLTNYEQTRYNEIIWFWTYDSLFGPVRSNDYIGLRYSPHFFDYVITSKDQFLYNQPQDIYFAKKPIFNAPPVQFPRSFERLRDHATRTIDDNGGQKMTRVTIDGGQAKIQQYTLGESPDNLSDLDPLDINESVIFVKGQVEVAGILDGRMTIGSAEDMWLIDDIRYKGANEYDGHFNPAEMHSMLGLASEANIIIADNEVNGRNDGWHKEQGNEDRHSIIIDAALIALNESFTFQHQNDRWDAYQGPTPDDRGIIHLDGSLAQWRRGYTHRSNHISTGYGLDRNYDTRLKRGAPPGFLPGDVEIYGNNDRLISWGGVAREATVRTLVVLPGSTIELDGDDALKVTDTLLALGNGDDSITFTAYGDAGNGTIRVNGGWDSFVDVAFTAFKEGVTSLFSADSIHIANTRIDRLASFEGNLMLDSSALSAQVDIAGWDEILLRRCLFLDGVTIRGEVKHGKVINNTFTGGRDWGLKLSRFGDLDIRNNIIAFNRYGVVNDSWNAPVLEYNCVYDNSRGDYTDCQAGQGSISRDPMFEDAREGDYRLVWNSPARDAGDPDSPRDPDGTRADMGAFYTDVLGVYTDPPALRAGGQVLDAMAVSPNPFNQLSVVSFQLSVAGKVSVAVYNVAGREVMHSEFSGSRGWNSIQFNGAQLGGTGVYWIRVKADEKTSIVKAVHIR